MIKSLLQARDQSATELRFQVHGAMLWIASIICDVPRSHCFEPPLSIFCMYFVAFDSGELAPSRVSNARIYDLSGRCAVLYRLIVL